MDEAALARRVIEASPEGDAGAEAELYRRLAPRVRLYGRKHLRDPHAADDLMQQVMLIVLDALRSGRVRDPERIVSFVLSTCRNALIDLKRTMARRDALLERFGDDLLPQDSTAELPAIDRDRLLLCLERLPERERSVVVAAFFETQDADEVARTLKLTAGNVRVIRHRAMERLRGCMGVEAMR